ncbi:glutamate racemase [uncultured Nevskia sp.]|uniref:glutamate racemase n=1 Tax=uncultured Nevskia sp. TaxID=228950 RepID=UPI0025D303AF|nr:glutamate racemase [uncultured Nevskia sp.]
MTVDKRPDGSPVIGVFDSGLGGLSVLSEIVARRPDLSAIYVADSGHCPYGAKSADQIIERATVITDFLLAQGAQLIVVACNTATIAAVEYLRATYSVPFVGMEPAVKPAVARTRSGVIGVLATGAALAGNKLLTLIDRHRGSVRVITQPCPGLVEQVEAGDLDGPVTVALLREYALPLLAAGADTLVLGCTHYPFLREALAQIVGPDVVLLDTGEAVARRVASLLPAVDSAAAAGSLRWYSSGELQQMNSVGSRLWGSAITSDVLVQDDGAR